MQPDVKEQRITGGQVRVGGFYTVDLGELEKGFGLVPMQVSPGSVSAEYDRNGIWSVDSRNNCLVRQKNPGKDTVGDVRIRYKVLDTFSGSGAFATVCGVPKGNMITRWNSVSGVALKGS